MDPFTITATCVGLIAAIAQLSSQISTFAKRVKDARNDMEDVLRELRTLSASLEKMRDDHHMEKYPLSLRQNLLDTLKSCGDVTKQMADLVQKLSSSKVLGRLQWSLSKRDKLMDLKSKLEGHKSAIAIALLVASIFLTIEVKDNTSRILSDTTAIRLETAQIPAQITTLYQCMGSLQLHIKDLKQRGDNAAGNMFQHVMDQTTTYTGAVMRQGEGPGRRSSDEFFDAQESPEVWLNPRTRSWAVPSRSAKFRIAIDFGMTSTAVCWCEYGSLDMNLNIIGKWPGNGKEFAAKVPSLVAYKSGKLVSWGFLADPVDSNGEIELYDNFKNLLGPDGLESFKPRKTDQPLGDGFDKVRQLHLDFFRELYIHIDKTLTNLAPFRQDGDDIEAIFSVPSTWNGSTLYHFRNLVKEAGLSSILRHHDQPVLLTEAEAVVESVLHELREQLPQKMIMLVVDVGGITMKSTVLSVDATGASQSPNVSELDSVASDGIGSKMIDINFQRLVTARLAPIEEYLTKSSYSVKKIALEMTKGDFQNWKAMFGKEGALEGTIPCMIRVPGVSEDFDSKEANVKRGRLTLTVNEIRALFDDQISEILSRLDHFLDKALSRAPESQLTHIVLSGGLGSSPYVAKRLKDNYQREHQHRFTQSAKFVDLQDPDLAVVKGMLLNRARQRLTTSVLNARVTRMSYGIVWNQLFNPHIHRDQEIFRDETDGQVYARNQIKWLVGRHFDLDRLENSQIELPMVHRVAVNKPVEPWKHPIVIGDGTTNAITTHSSPNGAQVVTNLICDFKSIPQTVRKPLSEKYEEIHYSIALIFRPASIDFEVRLEGAAYGSASYNTKWS